jgi:hypothetical protein
MLWFVGEIGVRRLTRPSWKLNAASELVYILLVVGWVALQAPLRGEAILASIETARSPVALGIASVYLAAIFGGERLVRRAIAPFLDHLPPGDQSALPRAGRVIGWSERFVVMTLIAAGYGEPVGWLLAAKTAMRYPEIKQESTGRLGEYFFVGTLLSISIGVVAGLAVRWLLAHPIVQ